MLITRMRDLDLLGRGTHSSEVRNRGSGCRLKQVEYWRWRYRDVQTGRICRTTIACTAEEARSRYPDAERIEGTMSLREEVAALSSSPPKCADIDGQPLGLTAR